MIQGICVVILTNHSRFYAGKKESSGALAGAWSGKCHFWVPDDRSVAIFRQWHLDVRSVAVGRSVSGCVYSPSVADNLLIMGNYHANGDIG